MIPASFAYARPTTVDEALQAIASCGEDVKILAGGQSLLPVMRLNETAHTDLWGDPMGPGRKILYGVGFSPIGFRLVWGQHWLRPYVSAKAGVDVWNHKFISDQGTYIQFTLHEALGGLVKLTDQVDLRMDVGDFHQSNGFMTDVNPGLDVATYEAALVYHMGSRRARVR